MRHARTVAFAGVLSFATSGLVAEDVVQLVPGTRARVTLAPAGERLVGTVVALDGTSLSLQTADRAEPMVLRREDVTRLAVSDGHRSRGKGALYGMVIGAGVGAVVGLVGGTAANSPENKAAGAIEGGIVLAMLGAPVGALVGLAVPPAERWKELPVARIRLSVAPVRGRGGAVSVTVLF